jgi:hypothetical protein
MRGDLRNSHHLATVSFDGRFWDAYLELEESQGPGQPARGRIAFSAPDLGDAEPVRTTTIFIEDTPQEVVVRAREFKTHQLVALLRSAIPPDEDADGSDESTGEREDAGGSEDAPGPRSGSGPTDPPDDGGATGEGQGDAADEL